MLDIRGVQKFKMAAYKPEVLISQLVDEIETPCQGIPPILGVEQLNGTIVHYTRHKGSPEIQDGGLQTGLQAAILNFWTPLCRV